ncbi:MAG TPA: hypothetical protein EYH55_04595 [Methanothermococcus okinawensis]|uniref:UPF0056 membrane protein n=1 Tax=Methanothermococcus okinawensis TaxID=155863 RepID=A0A832ZZP6_9EURY|nr:hypothetical protein [Methanothermococcus okinawensis]
MGYAPCKDVQDKTEGKGRDVTVRDIAVVPLGMPLLAGPGSVTTTLYLWNTVMEYWRS